jgi:competence protein ComEA
VFDKTRRRADRDWPASARLAQLIDHARREPPVPADHPPADAEWVDVSDSPDGVTPSHGSAGRPRGSPWWRAGRPGRLVERWLPGGPGQPTDRRRLPALLVIAVATGAAVAAGAVLTSGGAAREPAPDLPLAVSSTGLGPASRSGTGNSIVVSVIGRVVRPGLVTLPEGARVADAVREAGGPVAGADLSGLNLARRVADGEQVYVGVPAPADSQPASTGLDPSSNGGKVDLNTASVAQLDTLPGVGQVTAQRIIDWRTKHGRFTRVEQLREVDGIGPARYAQLKDLVVVG